MGNTFIYYSPWPGRGSFPEKGTVHGNASPAPEG